MVYPWGFESPPSHKRKAHGLAIDRGLFLCFPTKAANKTAGPDSIQGPAVLCMQEKGLEPSLTGNWCLKPARLPFRHSCTENLFSLSIFAGNVNSSACFCILQIFSGSYPIRDTADPMRFVKEVWEMVSWLRANGKILFRGAALLLAGAAAGFGLGLFIAVPAGPSCRESDLTPVPDTGFVSPAPEAVPASSLPQEEPVPEKWVCLTFDDGPSKTPPAVLDALTAAGVKAPFFVVAPGYNEKSLPLIADAAAAGWCPAPSAAPPGSLPPGSQPEWTRLLRWPPARTGRWR